MNVKVLAPVLLVAFGIYAIPSSITIYFVTVLKQGRELNFIPSFLVYSPGYWLSSFILLFCFCLFIAWDWTGSQVDWASAVGTWGILAFDALWDLLTVLRSCYSSFFWIYFVYLLCLDTFILACLKKKLRVVK
jgi:hypothetical protein